MNYWIFKCNPSRYRIAERLKDPEVRTSWITPQHATNIAAGDVAFIWQTGKPKVRGIVGALRLDSAPQKIVELEHELRYWDGEGADARLRVLATITHRCALIPAAEVAATEGLSDLATFRGVQQGTNFPADEAQGQILLKLVSDAS